MKDNFIKLMFNILKKLREIHNNLLILPERMEVEKKQKLVVFCMRKLNILFT